MSGPVVGAVRDLREALRHSCEVQTTCQPPSSWCKEPWPATIRDISTGGVSLRLARRFERGSGLAIELPTEDGGTTTVLARVVWIAPSQAHGGGWFLGCMFISELSDDEVRAVLKADPLCKATPVAADGLPNRSPSINGVLFQSRVNGEVLRWFVRRLDLSGSWPLPKGKVFSFRVGGPNAESLAAEMTIKQCRLIGSYWIVDCKFHNGLPDAVMQALTAPLTC